MRKSTSPSRGITEVGIRTTAVSRLNCATGWGRGGPRGYRGDVTAPDTIISASAQHPPTARRPPVPGGSFSCSSSAAWHQESSEHDSPTRKDFHVSEPRWRQAPARSQILGPTSSPSAADGRVGGGFRGSWTGPAQGHRFFAPGPTEPSSGTHSWSPSAPPKGRRPLEDDLRYAALLDAETRWSAWSPSPTCGTCVRRCGRRWRRNSRGRRPGAFSGHGRRVFSTAEHLFAGYEHDRDRRAGLRPRSARAPRSGHCDKQRRMLPMGVGRVVARSVVAPAASSASMQDDTGAP